MPQRARELGISVGELPAGRFNAISDVAGVLVGHTTLIEGKGKLIPGRGPIRTGVTVILPHAGNLFKDKIPAAVHTINGFGKVAGFEQVRELGTIESPIALTNTLNVGLVLDALVQYTLQQNPGLGIEPGPSSVNCIVGETNDSYLNDIQGRHVHADHVWMAINQAASEKIAEGAVGAGTGTTCFGWKGGIGTSSRIVNSNAGEFTLGALVQSNFGDAHQLIINSVPVGRVLQHPSLPPKPNSGSIMIILATDAPLSPRQLERLCVRATAGIARTGGIFKHGSGDFVIAFSTANRSFSPTNTPLSSQLFLADEVFTINLLFQAVIESVEEAILNSLFCAETTSGRDDHIVYGLPINEVVELLKKRI